MIYLVTNQYQLFNDSDFKLISIEESLEILKDCKVLQYDSETDGLDAHLNKLLCIQFGNKRKNFQMVIDALTIDTKVYKEILETKYLIGHNLKFDLQFLYNYNIIPRKVYDTMIVEQLLYLGYPKGVISYSLQNVAKRRLDINIDKSIREEIASRGLDLSVLKYAASDVIYLEDIMWKQIEDCKKINCLIGAKLECDCVPSIAYLEWCGIKLDKDKWKNKMDNDLQSLNNAKNALDNFVISNPILNKFTYIEKQGDLFEGFNTEPICTVNWSSSKQVVKVARILGFNTQIKDKKTGKDKDSVLEKHLKGQKGINDKFLNLYFDYQEHSKTVSSFGQTFLNAINPITGRLHTVFRQLETLSGRVSCGSDTPNYSLAKLNNVNPAKCTYCNLQQLPANEETRSSFVAPENYMFVSADFNSEESRLAADIYQDEEFLKEFLERSGDTHSMFCWIVFNKECRELGCTCVEDVKKKAPQYRKAVKAVEFAWLFGAAAPTIAQAANCTVEEAQRYIDNLEKGFKGVDSFAKKGSEFVRKNGYILINPITGHRRWWWDFKEWKKRQESYTKEFWEDYKINHKGTDSPIAQEVRKHFQTASKYDRDARNVVTQGTGAIIMKSAMTQLFNWIVDNNYFNKIHICASVHDEICCDYPKEIENFPKILENIMESAASEYCKSLPIPAEASVDSHWVH